MTPDLYLLKVFLTAADTLSFTRAAERLGVSQPRLSLLIRRLEEQVGFQLFARSHRRVSLTHEGDVMRQQAQVLEEVVRDMDELISTLRRQGRSRLRLGSPRYTLEIPERLAFVEDFNIRNPLIKLEIVSDRTPDLIDRMRGGELDLVFATVPFDDAGLEHIAFAQSRILLAIPEEDSLAGMERIPLALLAGRPFATYPRSIGAGYFDAWFGPLIEAGVQPVEAHDDHPAALLKFASRRRLSTVIHNWHGQRLPIDDGDRMVVRPLQTDHALGIELRLARRKGAKSATRDAFWTAAQARASRPAGPVELALVG